MERVGLFGATLAEAHMPLPGDDIDPAPMLEATHAVTIDVAAEIPTCRTCCRRGSARECPPN